MIESKERHLGKKTKQEINLKLTYIGCETFSFGFFSLLPVSLRHLKRACPVSSPFKLSLPYVVVL